MYQNHEPTILNVLSQGGNNLPPHVATTKACIDIKKTSLIAGKVVAGIIIVSKVSLKRFFFLFYTGLYIINALIGFIVAGRSICFLQNSSVGEVEQIST